MITRIHHVAIVTTDLDGLVAHWSAVPGVGAAGRIVTVNRPGVRLRSTMLPIGTGECQLQIVEPAEGPGVALLDSQGEGALLEVGFETRDIGHVASWLRARASAPVGLAGEPIPGEAVVAASGNRYLFLPAELTRGTRVEIVELSAGRDGSAPDGPQR